MCLSSPKYPKKLKNNKVSPWTSVGVPVALLMILGATMVPFFLAGNETAQTVFPWIFSAGAALLLLIRIFTPFRGEDMRLKRLHRIEAWSAIFFCAAAFFLFWPEAQLRDWLAFTLAGAVIQIITSIAIPVREAKLARGDKDSK